MTAKDIAIALHIHQHLGGCFSNAKVAAELKALYEDYSVGRRSAYRYIAAYRDYLEKYINKN